MVREGLALGGGLCESLSSGWEEGDGAGQGLQASRRLLLAEAAGPGGRPAVPQLLGLRVFEGPDPAALAAALPSAVRLRGRALPRDGAAARRERDRPVSRVRGRISGSTAFRRLRPRIGVRHHLPSGARPRIPAVTQVGSPCATLWLRALTARPGGESRRPERRRGPDVCDTRPRLVVLRGQHVCPALLCRSFPGPCGAGVGGVGSGEWEGAGHQGPWDQSQRPSPTTSHSPS